MGCMCCLHLPTICAKGLENEVKVGRSDAVEVTYCIIPLCSSRTCMLMSSYKQKSYDEVFGDTRDSSGSDTNDELFGDTREGSGSDTNEVV